MHWETCDGLKRPSLIQILGILFCLLRAIVDELAVIRFVTRYVQRIFVNTDQNRSLLLVLASRVVLGLGPFGTNDHILFVPRPLTCSESSILRDLYELILSFNICCSFFIYRSIFALILVSQTFINCYSFIEIVVTSSAPVAWTTTLLPCTSYRNLPQDGVNVWLDIQQKYVSKRFSSSASSDIFTVNSVVRK